jgi:hypothetical protein
MRDIFFGLRAIPALIFLVFAYFRFKAIRLLGFAKLPVYKPIFVFKLILQYSQALLEFVLMVIFVTSLTKIHNSKLSYVVLIFGVAFINVIAWVVSGKFLIYEYRKRLSEGLLTHQLFWTLSLILDGWISYNIYNIMVSSILMI